MKKRTWICIIIVAITISLGLGVFLIQPKAAVGDNLQDWKGDTVDVNLWGARTDRELNLRGVKLIEVSDDGITVKRSGDKIFIYHRSIATITLK